MWILDIQRWHIKSLKRMWWGNRINNNKNRYRISKFQMKSKKKRQLLGKEKVCRANRWWFHRGPRILFSTFSSMPKISCKTLVRYSFFRYSYEALTHFHIELYSPLASATNRLLFFCCRRATLFIAWRSRTCAIYCWRCGRYTQEPMCVHIILARLIICSARIQTSTFYTCVPTPNRSFECFGRALCAY